MNELKRVRIENNLTQVMAAKALGVSRRTYQKYEAMKDENNRQYKILLNQLIEKNTIDEDTGVLTYEDIIKLINKVLPSYNIKSCYLFGSYAKNRANESSDVDLLIDSNITGLDYYGLIEELREGLHKRVDLLTIDSIANNPTMLIEILKDGKRIYG